MTTPTTTRIIDSRITSRSTSRRCAPSAIRMPISLVRRDDAVRHQAEQADRREQQREPAEQRVGLREQLLLHEPALDLLDLRGDVHHRQVRIDLPAPLRESLRPWLRRIAGGPHLDDRADRRASAGTARTSSAAPRRARCCTSRRAARRRFRAGCCSRALGPKRWPIGFSFGKYFFAAASLITTTFGRGRVVAIREAAAEQHRNLHHVEEIRRDDQAVDVSRCPAGGVDAALHEDAGRVHAARQERRVRERGRADAGQPLRAARAAVIERRRALLVVPVELRVDAEQHAGSAG